WGFATAEEKIHPSFYSSDDGAKFRRGSENLFLDHLEGFFNCARHRIHKILNPRYLKTRSLHGFLEKAVHCGDPFLNHLGRGCDALLYFPEVLCERLYDGNQFGEFLRKCRKLLLQVRTHGV